MSDGPNEHEAPEGGNVTEPEAPLMRILSTEGVLETEVPEPKDRSLVIGHWNAIDRVLEGDKSKIAAYKGKVAAGHTLEADPKKITQWAKQGDLDFEDIYDFS